MNESADSDVPAARDVPETELHCAAHPSVVTALRCGKCETPICPRCMVQTPVGARCRSCANARRPVTYQVSGGIVVRGAAASVVLAIVVGALWAYLLPRGLNFLGFFVFFPALGYGWLAAEAVGRATRRRRGMAMQVVVGVSCALVYVVHNLLVGSHTPLPQNDLLGYAFVAVAAMVGIGYVR